jgi:hypothetical protein
LKLLEHPRVRSDTLVAKQLSFLELLERPTVEGLVKPDQVFTSDDWRFVVGHPENTRLDRKSARIAPAGLAECLSAFGNGPAVEGGVVVIGVEKDGTVTGCASLAEEKLQSLEYMGRDQCPDGRYTTNRLEVINARGKPDFIVRARVLFVEDRLVELTNGTAFCRESDRSRRLTETEKNEIRINKASALSSWRHVRSLTQTIFASRTSRSLRPRFVRCPTAPRKFLTSRYWNRCGSAASKTASSSRTTSAP